MIGIGGGLGSLLGNARAIIAGGIIMKFPISTGRERRRSAAVSGEAFD